MTTTAVEYSPARLMRLRLRMAEAKVNEELEAVAHWRKCRGKCGCFCPESEAEREAERDEAARDFWAGI